MKRCIAVLVVLVLLAGVAFFPLLVLEVYEPGEGRVLYQDFFREGELFTVRWIHSVSKFPVTETYRVDGPGEIPIIQMEFNEPGPNLPSYPVPPTTWVFGDGKWTVINYDLVFDAVPVRIGEVIADHTLIYRDKEIHLKDIDRPGGYVELRARRVTLAEYLYKGVRIWQMNRSDRSR